MSVRFKLMLLSLALALALLTPGTVPAQDKPSASPAVKPAEVIKTFVQAVYAKDLDTLFRISASGASDVSGRYAYYGQRTREDFKLALQGDPSICPPESAIGLNCRERAFRGDRVVTDVRLFIPQGCQWDVQELQRPLYANDQAMVAVKVVYTPQAQLVRVRGLQGVVGPNAGVRPPVPPFYGDGWVSNDNPLFQDTKTRADGIKFFIRYQRSQVLSGEVVFQLFKTKEGWLVATSEFAETKAKLGETALVDTSKK